MIDLSLPADLSEDSVSGSAPPAERNLPLHAFADLSDDPVIILSHQGSYQYVSPAHERLFGYAGAELLGQPAFDHVHPDDLPRLCDLLAEAIARPNQRVSAQCRYRPKDGVWQSVETKAKALPNGEIICVLRDITEHEQTEQALRAIVDGEAKLRESEAYFRSIIENANDGIAIASGERGFTYVSPSFGRMLGYTAEELLGTSPTPLTHPDESEQAMRDYLRMVENPGQPVLSEGRLRHKNGEWRFIESSCKLLPTGEILGTFRDVTRRRQLEDDLRRLNEELEDRVVERTAELQHAKEAAETALAESRRLAAIIEAMPDYIGMADLDGYSLYVNGAGKRMVGKTDADYPERWHVSSCYPEWEREKLAHVFEAVNRSGVWSGELAALHKDGHTFPCDHVVFAIRDTQGNIESYAAIMRDITERKRFEAELHQAKAAAEAAAQAKSIFLANMSHEIRTPMNAVIGMTGLLLNTALDDKQRDFAETIRGAGDTLLTIINDILDFSKIEAGKLTLERQAFDLRQCIESALDLLAPRAAEKGLDLAYVVDERTPAAIVGDVTRLRQILVNLLSNAIKFTERGEVVVSVVSSQQSAVGSQQLAAKNKLPTADRRLPTGYELRFSIKDTGIGIPTDKLDRLFQSFT